MSESHDSNHSPVSITAGSAPVIRGTLQWVVALLVLMNIALSVSMLAAATYVLRVIAELGSKPGLVFPVPPDGNTAAIDAASWRNTGPYDVELHATAWDVVRYIAGADSTNVAISFQHAKQIMTPECRKAFEREVEPSAKDLTELKIYRVLEAQPIGPMQRVDAKGAPTPADRYDLVVSGTMKTYRIGTNDLLTSGRFSYRVQMVPTQRSIRNSRGILVSRISAAAETKGEADVVGKN